jgi:hypothetical protein
VRKIGWDYARHAGIGKARTGVRWVTQYGVSAGMPGELPSDVDLPVMSLETSSLKAEAGGQAQTTLTLRNPGQLVESFRLDVVGLDDGWWQIHPPELALYPGEDSTAVVVLTPPAAARAPDRPLPFGVRAISTLDPSRGVVEEGDLEIGRVFDLQPSISPVTSRARWSARHTITFTNWGNTPVRLKLSATDKDGRLGFQLTPDAVVVPVGGRATARLRVRPSDPFLRGTPAHLPFQVHGEQPGTAAPVGPRSVAQRAGVPDPTQPVVDGAVLHGPILSKGVIMALIAVVAALAAAVALLFRAGDVKGARNEDTAPPPPTAVSVDAISGQLARVAWTGSDRALSYKVRTLDENGAPVKSDDVKGDVQVFDAKLEETETPRTQVCFEVLAVRGEFTSKASERKCAKLPDESLKPPTDVEAAEAAAGQFQVTWKGREKDAHVVLVDGAPAAPSSEYQPSIFSALINVPAGRHCITVFAKRGEEDVSPQSAPPKCVEATGPAATPSAGTGGPGGPGGPVPSESAGGNGNDGGPTPGNTGAGAPVAGFVALLGGPMFNDDNIAEPLAADLNSKNIPARIVPASAVPNHPDGPFPNPATILVVVEGFSSLQQAQEFCTNTVLPTNAQPCRAIQAGA